MTPLRAAVFCTALLAAAPTWAEHWDGTYDLGQCAGKAVSDGRIEITGDRIAFWETVCTLTGPTPIRDMDDATLYDADCSGEGQTWHQRILLMTDRNGGLVMVRRGMSYLYDRCD